jgi:hypothetical protein
MKRKLSVKDPISKFITDYPREMKLPSNIFSPTLQEFMKPYKIKSTSVCFTPEKSLPKMNSFLF